MDFVIIAKSSLMLDTVRHPYVSLVFPRKEGVWLMVAMETTAFMHCEFSVTCIIGHETSGNMLAFTLILVLQHPDVLNR